MTPKRPVGWAVGALVGFSVATVVANPPAVFQPSTKLTFSSPRQVKLYDFAPPAATYPTQETEAGLVTIFNGSPEPLEIVLTNGANEQVLLQFPACPDCPIYAPGQTPQSCEIKSAPATYVLNPGEYAVEGAFTGQTWGFRSRWQIASGWEYQQCLFSTYDPGGGGQ
jgi:hypothetical protein